MIPVLGAVRDGGGMVDSVGIGLHRDGWMRAVGVLPDLAKVPDAPQNLRARVEMPDIVELRWDRGSGVGIYEVWRSTPLRSREFLCRVTEMVSGTCHEMTAKVVQPGPGSDCRYSVRARYPNLNGRYGPFSDSVRVMIAVPESSRQSPALDVPVFRGRLDGRRLAYEPPCWGRMFGG